MTTQSFEHLKKLALRVPALPRGVARHGEAEKFYEQARRLVPVLVDELERLREDDKRPKQEAKR